MLYEPNSLSVIQQLNSNEKNICIISGMDFILGGWESRSCLKPWNTLLSELPYCLESLLSEIPYLRPYCLKINKPVCLIFFVA